VSDTVRGEDGADPAKDVTDVHGLGDVLQGEDHNDQETTRDEVEEECGAKLCRGVKRAHHDCGCNDANVLKQRSRGKPSAQNYHMPSPLDWGCCWELSKI
jgi:hypothetical protein